MIWEDEFAIYDKDKVVEATRQLCRTTEDNFNINIASIKNKVAEMQKGIDVKLENERYQQEMAEKEHLFEDTERLKKISERIEKTKRELMGGEYGG